MFKKRAGQYLLAAAVLLFLSTSVTVADTTAMIDPKKSRSDILTISADVDMPGRQMPLIQFLHDRHTQALDGQCDKCHDQTSPEKTAFTFKGIVDMDIEVRMERFHENCTVCHAQMKSPTGPDASECRTCHNADTPMASNWKDRAFDRSLHHRHETSEAIRPSVSGSDTNCSACHHNFNEARRELYYEPGQEGACIYCHKAADTLMEIQDAPQQPVTVRPARKAAHDSCVTCHVTLVNEKIKTGPVDCAGCHDAAAQAAITVLDEVPRLKRNQPDIVLLTGWDSLEGDPDANARLIASHMNPVAFDHARHETANTSCTACHHDSLDACITCHTTAGTEKGGHVKLADLMHNVDSTTSCTGCHTQIKQAKECAGCHAQMPAKAMKDQACDVCHSVDVKNRPRQKELTDPEFTAAMAEDAVAQRALTYDRVPMDQVPEIVTIGTLSNEYQPSRFPHLKVVKAIFEKTDQSEMARAFHGQELTLCAGCHHNSPPAMNPPRCASCHGTAPDVATDKPGLMGAYHGQCITCHQKMEVASVTATDCIKCHEKK